MAVIYESSWARMSDDQGGVGGLVGQPTYRYELSRTWDPSKPLVAWCMLNPSTADGTTDDHTVRKVVGYSSRWGYGTALIVNLFALRARNPKHLTKHPDPVGPGNIELIEYTAANYPIVAAWGAAVPNEQKAHEAWAAALMKRSGAVILGRTNRDAPWHPLITPYAIERQAWNDLASK